MPLPQLVDSIGHSGLAVDRAHAELRSCETYVVGLGFRGEPPPSLADKSWLYCPDPDVAWQRATMLSNYDPANAGTGRWSVLFEVGRSDFRSVSAVDAIRSIRDSVTRLGADLSKLVDQWDRVLPMGYPVPTIGRDELLHDIDDFLKSRGVRSRGRFGGWRYESCNQDYSWAQGVQAIDAAYDGGSEDAYWHPERY
jgi:protoporphyrinogen oxidase